MSTPENNPYRASSPYGNTPSNSDNTPPAPPVPPAPSSPYENSPYSGGQPNASAYENSSPYAQAPYAQGGVPGNGVETEEGKKNAKIGLISGIVGIFFFGLILGLVALHFGKKANATGGNGKPAIILGIVDLSLWVVFILFRLVNN